jgi:hypothetical protein
MTSQTIVMVSASRTMSNAVKAQRDHAVSQLTANVPGGNDGQDPRQLHNEVVALLLLMIQAAIREVYDIMSSIHPVVGG